MGSVDSLTVREPVRLMKHVRRTDWTAKAIPLNAKLRCHGAPALDLSYPTRLMRPSRVSDPQRPPTCSRSCSKALPAPSLPNRSLLRRPYRKTRLGRRAVHSQPSSQVQPKQQPPDALLPLVL